MVHSDDLRQTAYNAEHDLNTHQAKRGVGHKSDSSMDILFFLDTSISMLIPS